MLHALSHIAVVFLQSHYARTYVSPGSQTLLPPSGYARVHHLNFNNNYYYNYNANWLIIFKIARCDSVQYHTVGQSYHNM